MAAEDRITLLSSEPPQHRDLQQKGQFLRAQGRQHLMSEVLSDVPQVAAELLQGEPLIIVQDGGPIERNLRSERLTLEDVMTEARGNDIAALDEIKWAVLEAGGKITFVKK